MSFFNQVRRHAGFGLGLIPGTTTRRTQAINYRKQVAQSQQARIIGLDGFDGAHSVRIRVMGAAGSSIN
jgi:hypothetical protein